MFQGAKERLKKYLYGVLNRLYAPILSEFRKPVGGGGIEMLLRREFLTTQKVLSLHATLDEMIHKRKILIRLGDGEFPILQGRDGGFHRYSLELRDRLLQSYYFALGCDAFIVSILPVFLRHFTRIDDPHLIGSCRSYALMDFLSFFPLREYGNAEILRIPPIYFYKEKHLIDDHAFTKLLPQSFDPSFYHRSDLGREIFAYYQSQVIEPIKSLWADHHLIVCEGVFSRFGMHNDLLKSASSIHRVQAENYNAFASYELILQDALKKAGPLPKEKVFFICALGHTSKILLTDLYKHGYSKSLDAGNFSIAYDSFLHAFPYEWIDDPIQKHAYPPLHYGFNLTQRSNHA